MPMNFLRRVFRPRPKQILGAIAAFSAVVLLVCFSVLKSDAYEFAEEFVAHDARVLKLTGQQSKRSLRWLSGFSMSSGDETGEASLTVRVASERGTFDIDLVMGKKQGRWNVLHANAKSGSGEKTVLVE